MATTKPDSGLVWQLGYELDHFTNWPDIRFDLCADGILTNSGYTTLLSRTVNIDLPSPAVFKAISDAVPYTDYPYNDLSWPIMSRRMLEILSSVRNFPHQTHPIRVRKGATIVDDVDFIGVQLTSHCDYFDWEQSEYEPGFTPRRAVGIEEFVLTIPEEGFPPIFRLSAVPTRLFISNDARQALKAAGIRGPAYLRLDFYKRTKHKEVDVPVIVPTR